MRDHLISLVEPGCDLDQLGIVIVAKVTVGGVTAGWSASVDCSGDARAFLKRLDEAGWVLDSRAGEYAVVTCNCVKGHTNRVILWPAVPDVLHQVVRMMETTTCLGETT